MKTPHIVIYLALVLLLTLVGSAGCIRSEPKLFVANGEILTIVISEIQEVDRVLYVQPVDGSEELQTFAITPRQEGNILAMAKARIVNQKSTRVSLTLDREAVTLHTEEAIFSPMYYAENSEPTDDVIPEGYAYAPLLWGNIDMLKGFEVTGWFVFEVPAKSKFTAFQWDDVESILVHLSR